MTEKSVMDRHQCARPYQPLARIVARQKDFPFKDGVLVAQQASEQCVSWGKAIKTFRSGFILLERKDWYNSAGVVTESEPISDGSICRLFDSWKEIVSSKAVLR